LADVPVGLTNLIAVAGGDYHSVGLKSDGTVVAWGKNSGIGGVTNIPHGLSNIVAISCGSAHTLALKVDGTVVVWGSDLGNSAAPTLTTNLVAVTTMGWWNLALRYNGTVVDWGLSYSSDVPKPTNLTNVIGIVTGYGYAEVLHTDGTLQGWGRGEDATNIPSGLTNVVMLASGDYHRVGLAPMNLPPKSLTRSASGGMNKPLIVSLGGFDPNGDLITFRIASLPAKGKLWQYTTNGLGTPINAPDAVVTDLSRVYFVPESDEYGSPYASFDFIANDGSQDSPPATQTVTILPTPLIQTAILTNTPTQAFVLGFTGLSNVSYSVWRSTDLSLWTKMGSSTQISSGQFSFTDNTISNAPIRFYRIRSP
jgi:hypothetical protein